MIGILGLVVIAAFLARLAVGTIVPLDADEATEGVAAYHILHGHFVLMEANARYLGALDSYLLAPFVAVFGTSVTAIRVGMSLMGAIYAVLMFALGWLAFGRHRAALLMAGIAAVFPLFALTYGVKARTYGVLLLLEALCLILAVRLGWPSRPLRTRDWVVFGFAVGLSVWHDVLLAIPVFVAVVALLARGSAIGWAQLRRGTALWVGAAIVGFAPWIVYNIHTHLGSLRHLYTPLTTYSVPTSQAIKDVLAIALPIFVGDRVNYCGPSTIPNLAIDFVLLLLLGLVVWARRHTWIALARGRFAVIEPVDMILVIGPLAVVAVTAKWFNSLSCEPRYLMPLAVPLVAAFVLLLSQRAASAIAAILLVGLLVISVFTAQRQAMLTSNLVVVPRAPSVRVDWPTLVKALEARHPQAIWAQYWLARPIQYTSADQLVVGEYGGYVGFPETQLAALAASHPSWLFVTGSADIPTFEAACSKRGITYTKVTMPDDLVLYADLSQAIAPVDAGFPTQSVSQAN